MPQSPARRTVSHSPADSIRAPLSPQQAAAGSTIPRFRWVICALLFLATTINDGALCARGTIPARSCSDALPSACGEGAWGVEIGLDVRREGGPWGRSASSYVAVEYRGAKRVRLAAHRAGDESDREYCVDGYASGAIVGAARFGIECWRGGGDVLASFKEIDKFTVELAASDEASMFNYCVTAIRVGNAIDAAVGPADVPATRVPSAHK